MGVKENWLANLLEIVKREIEEAGTERRAYQAIALKTGLSEEYIYQVYKAKPKADGSRRLPGEAAARALGRVYAEGRPVDWIDLPAGRAPTLPSSLELPPGAVPVSLSNVRPVWVVGKGSGGFMPERLWTDGDYPVGDGTEFGDIATSDPHAFLAEVSGRSMVPRFNPGEYALVEPGTEPELEDDVLVRLATGHTLIKRLLSRRDGFRFGSYNDAEVLNYDVDQVSWVYYIAHPVPRRKIKQRH